MVGLGQNLVVEIHQPAGHRGRGGQGRKDNPVHVDAGGLEGHNLVVGGEPAEGHEDRHQHGHGHGQRHNPGQVQHENLQDDEGIQPLGQDAVDHLDDKIHDKEESDDGQAVNKRGHMLAEDIAE